MAASLVQPIGIDLRRFGGGRLTTRATARPIYALSFSLGSYFATAAGGGEQGVGSGFGIGVLGRQRGVTGANQRILNARSGGGYDLVVQGSGALALFMWTGTSTFVSATLPLRGSKLGQLDLWIGQYTGSQVRLAYDMLLSSATAAAATYQVPASPPTVLGAGASLTESADLIDIAGVVTWRGVRSDEELAQLYTITRQKGDVPTAAEWPYGVTHRASLRDALGSATHGQVAPTSLADTVTRVTADAMTRQGSPTVSVIDPSVDGRKSYGMLGFSTGSYLIGSAHPFGDATVDMTVDLTLHATTASRHIANVANSGPTLGFALHVNASSQLAVYSYAAGATVAFYALTSADLGVRTRWRVTYNGAVWRLYKNDVQQGSDGAFGYTPAVGQPLRVGISSNVSQPLDTGTVHRVKVGAHEYDFTLDISPDPSAGVPATMQDRIGIDHLTRVGGRVQIASVDGVAGLTGLSGVQFFQTSSPGGVGGIQPLFVAVDVTLGDYGDADILTHYIAARGNIVSQGWELRVVGPRSISWTIGNGTTRQSCTILLSAADFGRRVRIVGQVSGTLSEVFFDTADRTSSRNDTAYVAFSGPTTIGVQATTGSNPNDRMILHGIQAGSAALTAAERDALLADTTFAGVPGKTTWRHWFPSDIGEAGGAVPSATRERTTNGDALLRVGAPIQVAARTERLWSYETTPIMRGIETVSTVDYYGAPINALPGDAAGFCVGALVRILGAPGTSATRRVFAQRTGDASGVGWEIITGGTNNAANFQLGNGGTATGSSTLSVTSALYGKLMWLLGVWDAAAQRVRLYAQRVEVGSGTAHAAGFAPRSDVAPMIGRRAGISPSPLEATSVLGVGYWIGIPTLAQYQSQHDAIVATERVQPMPGLSGWYWDLSEDTGASDTPPATLIARGSAAGPNFTKVGAPTQHKVFARAWTI